jgi:hypothetical protein
MKNIRSFRIGSQNTKIECFYRKKKLILNTINKTQIFLSYSFLS